MRASFSEDIEVHEIADRSDIPRPESVALFENMIAQWLHESYYPPLMKTRTHTGYGFEASESAHPCSTFSRTESTGPSFLELEAKPFFERSAVFLRLKAPFGFGRGYGRSQPFKMQDVLCWQRVKAYDWNLVTENDMDILAFINHWFECDFTWEVLRHVIDVDPVSDSFAAIVSGDAQVEAAVTQFTVDDPCVEFRWECQVCFEDGQPTLNTVKLAALSSATDSDFLQHDFCSTCRTYRYDRNMWLCLGPPSRSAPPRTKSKPCRRALRMFDVTVAVPCCPACETIRYKFQHDEVFQVFSNSEDEPMPERMLRV